MSDADDVRSPDDMSPIIPPIGAAASAWLDAYTAAAESVEAERRSGLSHVWGLALDLPLVNVDRGRVWYPGANYDPQWAGVRWDALIAPRLTGLIDRWQWLHWANRRGSRENLGWALVAIGDRFHTLGDRVFGADR